MDLAAKPLRVVLLGPPASGKGTQGRRLASSLHLSYLSTGALLREHVESGTELGKKLSLFSRAANICQTSSCSRFLPIGFLSKQAVGFSMAFHAVCHRRFSSING
ncbi:MAG: AAA family ATPase [Akkermansiaceae bacterium]|nr:AAA family ATPase [Akkermansiaceae bacterium]